MSPVIHLNGTDGAQLAAAYERAEDALTLALNALAATAPNARDYYPLGPDAFAAAQRAHDERTAALRRIDDQITFIRRDLAEQNGLIAACRAGAR